MLSDIVHRLGAPDTSPFSDMVPLKRLGSVGEIAQAVAFLASAESSYMTGHAMVLDGGLTVDDKLDLAATAERPSVVDDSDADGEATMRPNRISGALEGSQERLGRHLGEDGGT